MSDFGFFNAHRTWEDWFGMLLGVLIVASPWFPFQDEAVMGQVSELVLLNAVVVGLVVFGLAQLEYVATQRWEEVLTILIGLWLIVSPYFLGYAAAGFLRLYHTGLGSVVVLLGVLQLWQDWETRGQEFKSLRSDQDFNQKSGG